MKFRRNFYLYTDWLGSWKARRLESKIICEPFSLIASKLPSFPANELFA